ncbi:hypothetical protein Bca4012_067007 [Brassica carinata]
MSSWAMMMANPRSKHHHLRNLISASSAPSVIPNPTPLDFSPSSSFFFYPPISTSPSPTAPFTIRLLTEDRWFGESSLFLAFLLITQILILVLLKQQN